MELGSYFVLQAQIKASSSSLSRSTKATEENRTMLSMPIPNRLICLSDMSEGSERVKKSNPRSLRMLTDKSRPVSCEHRGKQRDKLAMPSSQNSDDDKFNCVRAEQCARELPSAPSALSPSPFSDRSIYLSFLHKCSLLAMHCPPSSASTFFCSSSFVRDGKLAIATARCTAPS